MEACPKRPLSACGPQDWLVGKDNNGVEKQISTIPDNTDLNALLPPLPPTDPAAPKARAGTTSQPPAGEFIVSPRRVAFKRDQYGALIPDGSSCTPADLANNPNSCSKATPIGVDATNKTVSVPYTAGSPLPPAADNALWYWTTKDDTNPSLIDNPSAASPTPYNNTHKLYYLPFDSEAVSERQFLLPGLPEFPAVMGIISTGGINGTSAAVDDASDFAVFTISGGACKASKAYQAIAALNSSPINCATSTQAATGMGNLWTGLRNPSLTSIPPVISVQTLTLPAVIPAPPASPTPVPPLKANAKVNIYNLPAPPAFLPNASVLSNVEITLDRNGQDNPIFVFRTEYNLAFLDKVTIKLKGVDPNNIFWVPKEGTLIWGRNEADTADIGHELVGNFIGGDTGAFIITKKNDATFAQVANLTKPIINGGRIFRYNQTPGTLAGNAMTAMTTTAQPLLVPVLQLHSPQGNPTKDDIATALGRETISVNYWVQRVDAKQQETYNAVFIMGDSPVRPLNNTKNPGEGSGGLGNFPRFLEAWESKIDNRYSDDKNANPAKTEIKGSFFQFKKSAFATAPFEAVDDTNKDNSLFFDGLFPDYMNGFNYQEYRYKGGAQGRKAPYYRPPSRQWGYDVGLLSQTPDLFSRRFANPSAGTPNEYFREVGRDDRWIQTLLCAAQQTTGAGAAGYDWAIADSQQRPASCGTAKPGAEFKS
jgi:hypothetical protein